MGEIKFSPAQSEKKQVTDREVQDNKIRPLKLARLKLILETSGLDSQQQHKVLQQIIEVIES